MAAPAPPPTPLAVVPHTAEVNANAACQFTVEPKGTEVEWKIQPEIGSIDQNGVYQSPKDLKMSQTVIVTATAKLGGQSATAVMNLTDAPAKILGLGWYAVIVALVIGVVLLVTWSDLYQRPTPIFVVVNPPLVTLDPSKDDRFPFTVAVLGDSKTEVTWSVEPATAGEVDAGGMFRRKLDTGKDNIDQAVKITAHSVADPTKSGTAVVQLLSGKHLEITPSLTSVFPGQQSTYRTPNESAKWSVSRSDLASISPTGVFTAGLPNQTSVVQVTAWGPVPHDEAAVAVVISVPFKPTDSRNWPILIFVIVCGSLGSMIYYSSSFVAYVGNQTFRSSWLWFYISRPFVGGALAVIFFFLFGSGMIAGAAGFDLMKIGLISALVGLFSDKAVKKLSDVLDVLLATKDDRKDKIAPDTNAKPADTKPQSGTTATPPAPPTPAPVTPGTVPAATIVPVEGATSEAAAVDPKVASITTEEDSEPDDKKEAQ